jgi:hypothetical protein
VNVEISSMEETICGKALDISSRKPQNRQR